MTSHFDTDAVHALVHATTLGIADLVEEKVNAGAYEGDALALHSAECLIDRLRKMERLIARLIESGEASVADPQALAEVAKTNPEIQVLNDDGSLRSEGVAMALIIAFEQQIDARETLAAQVQDALLASSFDPPTGPLN